MSRKVYIFQDCHDNFFFGEFESIDAAKRYAYRAGLCFIGSTMLPAKEGETV